MDASNVTPGLLSRYFQGVDWSLCYRISTKRYGPHFLSTDDANRLTWSQFRQNTGVLAKTATAGTDLEMLVVAKSVTWSDRDANIYIGCPDRIVRSMLDFSQEEFVRVFGMLLRIITELSGIYDEDVFCTHGFNPSDSSPDGHSVRMKMHCHVHIPDKNNRVALNERTLTIFDKLVLTEPFNQIFWDFALSRAGDALLRTMSDGREFFSFDATRKEFNRQLFHQIYDLVLQMEEKYTEVASIFTSGQTEQYTGFDRYIPRPLNERQTRLQLFVDANKAWLSRRSYELLDYLANNLKAAQARDKTNVRLITDNAQLWIARDFCGAINLVAHPTSDLIKCDFAPRVISTAGAERILSDSPTIVMKGIGVADEQEQERMHAFEANLTRLTLGADRP